MICRCVILGPLLDFLKQHQQQQRQDQEETTTSAYFLWLAWAFAAIYRSQRWRDVADRLKRT